MATPAGARPWRAERETLWHKPFIRQGDHHLGAPIDEGGQGMPAYKDMLSDGEKDDLIAYLKTL